MNLRKILLPLDGSSFAEQALAAALRIAQQSGAQLELLTVLEHPQGEEVAAQPGASDPTARAKAYLSGVVERVRARAPIDVRPVVIHGPVAERILDYTRTGGASLVVMTTHGWGPLSRAWFGSVTDHLVRTSHTPILLMRPQPEEPPPDAFQVPPRIIIPLDGSSRAEQILEPAVALGSLWSTDYRLVRVVSPGDGDWDAAVRQRQDQAKQYLVEAWQRLAIDRRPKSWNTRAVVIPDVATWILKYAQRHDLIALATRGQGGLQRLLLGSVADKVIRGAVGPILVRCPLDEE